ncbi:cAMP phosphodiesterase [Prochlorococcus sp. MIT 0801]|uniref:cAMP phosphodiesterase n=1 Tax=Prochlorococcus sp. MIT 0801 TaxID=1501269 RepID=UPI0004F6EAC9|nr:cAMP phosphodiesterase [Prochlorococcus sp. MIT 0801]AIQ97049.1 putative cAMP phosphodiesterases class-II precursor [Prochlorococcus sp. MIT 0801]
MNCKSLILSIVFICTGSTSILADEFQRGYSSSRTCTRNEYREEYIPGTRNDPGYVKKWEETVEVPCPGEGSIIKYKEVDKNDCSEGKIAGGILGAGFATAISRGKDRWWAIPAGLVGGSIVGCEIDGG